MRTSRKGIRKENMSQTSIIFTYDVVGRLPLTLRNIVAEKTGIIFFEQLSLTPPN